MNINDLSKIKKVDASPFLFTHIQYKIENLNSTALTIRTSWALSISFILIVSLNIGLIIKSQNTNQSIEKYPQIFNLTSNNTLYK